MNNILLTAIYIPRTWSHGDIHCKGDWNIFLNWIDMRSPKTQWRRRGKCKSESVSSSFVFDSLRPHGLCSPSGSPVNGILQARILEWVAIPLFRALNLGLLHCRQILNCLNHQGSLGCLLLKGRGELEVGFMVSFQHTSLSLHEINLAWHK